MKQRFIQAAAAALLLGALPVAQATPTLSYSLDGGAAVTCADGAACDLTAAGDGAVAISYSVGDLSINVTTGVTKPAFSDGTPLMDINSLNVQLTGGAHELVLMFSDTDFNFSGDFSGLFGGTLSGTAGGTIEANAYVDAGNALFATTTEVCGIGPFGLGAFAGTCSGGGPAPVGPYSVTQVLTLNTAGPTTFSGDFEISVPEPGTLALLGVGLGLFGFSMRRRQQAS